MALRLHLHKDDPCTCTRTTLLLLCSSEPERTATAGGYLVTPLHVCTCARTASETASQPCGVTLCVSPQPTCCSSQHTPQRSVANHLVGGWLWAAPQDTELLFCGELAAPPRLAPRERVAKQVIRVRPKVALQLSEHWLHSRPTVRPGRAPPEMVAKLLISVRPRTGPQDSEHSRHS